MDGIEATEKIRALPYGKEVKIVALTASVFAQQRQEFLDAGVNGIVNKPYREQDIFDNLNKYLGVKFIYERPNGESTNSQTLSIDALKLLPEHILKELEHSIASLDIEQSLMIVDQIQNLDTQLAKQLSERIHQFDFETLNKLFARLN